MGQLPNHHTSADVLLITTFKPYRAGLGDDGTCQAVCQYRFNQGEPHPFPAKAADGILNTAGLVQTRQEGQTDSTYQSYYHRRTNGSKGEQ